MGNKVMPNEVLYHIGISAEMLKGAEYALLPGDPGRVEAWPELLAPLSLSVVIVNIQAGWRMLKEHRYWFVLQAWEDLLSP